MKMIVDAFKILWTLDYFTNRPKYVRPPSGFTSDLVYTNTGGPQGTCLLPFLFTLYSADCRSTHEECQTDKFAADTPQIGQITDDVDRHYLKAITDFVQWCENNFL